MTLQVRELLESSSLKRANGPVADSRALYYCFIFFLPGLGLRSRPGERGQPARNVQSAGMNDLSWPTVALNQGRIQGGDRPLP